MADMLAQAQTLLEGFDKLSNEEKWKCPFPMGVFGTLRKGNGNAYLMGRPEGSKEENSPRFRNHTYRSWHKAFLPDFHAIGLSIKHEVDDSAVFEVYTYEPDQWKEMIPSVDALEGFSPGHQRLPYSYWRTLVMMRILPDDFEHEAFESGLAWGKKRVLDIPRTEWEQYQSIPCWVYSSSSQNDAARSRQDHPIIWDGLEPIKADPSEFVSTKIKKSPKTKSTKLTKAKRTS